MVVCLNGKKVTIYTMEYDDSYALENIVADDIVSLRQAVSDQKELWGGI